LAEQNPDILRHVGYMDRPAEDLTFTIGSGPRSFEEQRRLIDGAARRSAHNHQNTPRAAQDIRDAVRYAEHQRIIDEISNMPPPPDITGSLRKKQKDLEAFGYEGFPID